MNLLFSKDAWGKEIFRTYDEFGPLYVYDDGNKRYLAFDDINEQSCQHKTFPTRLMHEYNVAMLLPLLFLQPRHVTLFGLGGGSLVQSLLHWLPEVEIQVVEIRGAVVEIAQRFFQLPRSPRLHISVQDAGDYLQSAASNSTDFLLCDMYLAFDMDNQQRERNFIHHCARILGSQGWFSANYSQSDASTQQVAAICREEFMEVRRCPVTGGNQILFAGKQPLTVNDRDLLKRARRWSPELGHPLSRYARSWGKVNL